MSSPSLPPARSYERLKGGDGRSIYFRAPRYRTRGLLDRVPPVLEVGGDAARLYDLSATGLSYWDDGSETVPAVGTRVPIRLTLGDVVAFEGESEIVRHQLAGDRLRVALRFVGDHAMPMRLKAIHDRVAFERAVDLGLDDYAAVPARYRGAVDRGRAFVEHWRRLLDEREQGLRASEREEELPRLLEEVETRAEHRMRAEWRTIHVAANEASREIVEGAPLAASKRYTETMLTSALHDVPLVWHTYTKPRGYPGDFEAMSSMYEGQREGASIFARIMDQLGHEERLAATVVIRKRFLVEQLRECVDGASRRHESPTRIVSIGSGPAREIVDFLEASPPGRPMEFVLVDQDEDALEFASEQLRRAARPHGDRVRILCRHLSFAQLFALPDLVAEVSDADMIYTAGLFDYLSEHVGRALMNGCFGLLREGGRLVVGNAAAGPGVRWMPEFVLDWTMIYRSEAELRDLARDFADRAQIEMESDQSASWLFLVAHARTQNGC